MSTILQPRDSHVLKVQDYVIGGTGFTSSMGHFYDAKELLEKYGDHWVIRGRFLIRFTDNLIWLRSSPEA